MSDMEIPMSETCNGEGIDKGRFCFTCGKWLDEGINYVTMTIERPKQGRSLQVHFCKDHEGYSLHTSTLGKVIAYDILCTLLESILGKEDGHNLSLVYIRELSEFSKTTTIGRVWQAFYDLVDKNPLYYEDGNLTEIILPFSLLFNAGRKQGGAGLTALLTKFKDQKGEPEEGMYR